MIYVWLGSFVLTLFSLKESQKYLARLSETFQQKIYESSLDAKFDKMLPRALSLSVLGSSPRKTELTALSLYNICVLGKRSSVLMMGLASLGAWWILVLSLGFMSINGLMLVGICILAIFTKNKKWQNLFQLLFFTGLFFYGAELLARYSANLQMSLGDSSLAFFLVENHLLPLLGMLLLGFVLSFVITIEFWTVCLALALLAASAISLNGAASFFAGEMIASGILLFWRGRKLNQECQNIAMQMGLSSAVGALLGWVLALILQEVAGEAGSFGMDGLSFRLLRWTALVVLILFTPFFAKMLVGHFLARRVVDEVQAARYFPPHWSHQELLCGPAVVWGRQRLSQRIQEIRYHLQGLVSLKEGQIPEAVQIRLRREEKELAQLYTDLNA